MLIREATGSDVVCMSEVHLRGFPGFFLSALGGRFLTVMYDRMLRLPEVIAFVAENQDGNIIGFVVGATEQAVFWRRLLREYWWAFAFTAIGPVLRRPRLAASLFRAARRPFEAGELGINGFIASLAVTPQQQGQHVGADLVSAFLFVSRRRGVGLISLTTDADDNEQTNRFYHQQGFSLRRRYRTPEGRRMNEYVIKLSE